MHADCNHDNVSIIVTYSAQLQRSLTIHTKTYIGDRLFHINAHNHFFRGGTNTRLENPDLFDRQDLEIKVWAYYLFLLHADLFAMCYENCCLINCFAANRHTTN